LPATSAHYRLVPEVSTSARHKQKEQTLSKMVHF